MAITLKELSEKLNVEGTSVADLNDALDKLLEPKELEVAEEAEEAPEEAEEAAEEAEEAQEEAAEEPESEEAEESEEITLATVLEAINGLQAQLEAVRTENETLKSQLAARDEAEKKLTQKVRNLVVSLSDEPKKPETTAEVDFTDGIGE